MGYHYEILEHKADIKFKITADNLNDLFEGALKGMADILTLKEDLTEEKIEKNIKVSSLDLSSLLVDFLSEILTFSDIEDCVFNEVKINDLKNNKIEAKISGFKFKKLKEEIKAVTYHQSRVEQNKDGQWEAVVLFDI
ncbi:MAG TPA: archease [Candidatus Paceibacterota bacterium]|nr:archease [Candidatus Paceibacterota bacterium]